MKIKNAPHNLISYNAPNFIFHIMHSVRGYKTKQEAATALATGTARWKIAYNDTGLTVKQFAEKVANGHIFCSSMCNTKKKNFENRAMEYTNTIFFDIDHLTVSLYDFFYWMNNTHPDISPTLFYESYNSTFDKPRIRLVYVFDEQLQIRRRAKIYNYIKECIYDMFPNGEVTLDTCYEKNPTQMVYSTSITKVIDGSGKIFKTHFTDESQTAALDELIDILTDKELLKEYVDGNITLEHLLGSYYYETIEGGCTIKLYNEAIYTVTSEDILDAVNKIKAMDYNSDYNINKKYSGSVRFKELMDELCCKQPLIPSDFIEKHKDEFELLTKTKVDFGELTTIETPNDYFDLNWLRLWNGHKIVRRPNGKRRRAILSMVAGASRLIKRNITPEEVFYNLVYERMVFIDNSEDPIHNHELRKMVLAAFNKEIGEIWEELLPIINDHRTSKIIKEGSSRKSIGSVKGHKPTRKLTFNPELINWSLPYKENFLSIKKDFPELKEITFYRYYNRHYNDKH